MMNHSRSSGSIPSKALSDLQDAKLNACTKSIEEEYLKKIELELARDGILFWHLLFDFFGLRSDFRPYAESKYNSGDSKKIQPSITHHKQLFRVLQLNIPSNPNSIFEIYRRKKFALEDLKSLDPDVKKSCPNIRKYFDLIQNNVNELNRIFQFDTEEKLLEKKIIKTLDAANASFSNDIPVNKKSIEFVLNELQRLVDTCFADRFLESVGIKFPLFRELFKKTSYLQSKEVCIEPINDLVRAYSQFKEEFKSDDDPDKNENIHQANVVTASFYMKYKHLNQGNKTATQDQYKTSDKSLEEIKNEKQEDEEKMKDKESNETDFRYVNIEVYYPNTPALSTFKLTSDENKKLDLKMQDLFKQMKNKDQIPEGFQYLDACASHHSEKALVASLENKLPDLAQSFQRKLCEDKIQKTDSFQILEIGLQLFSVREYCHWCEGYLSDELKEVYNGIEIHLKSYFKNLEISQNQKIITRHCSYSLNYNNKPPDSNPLKENQFMIDRINPKSYFAIQFLKDILTYKLFNQPRTYFVNDILDWEEARRERYMTTVSNKAKEINSKISK